MIKEIITDEEFLAKKSTDATVMDIYLVRDLKDTLKANADNCVGMAANMIGVSKKIIAFYDDKNIKVMINPEIISCSGKYSVMEGCLSLQGKRLAKRYKEITVKYLDESFALNQIKFSGFTAEIIQHEIDHCNGIVI